jgi:purine/pyrimidine-nucleoside phosphorylase
LSKLVKENKIRHLCLILLAQLFRENDLFCNSKNLFYRLFKFEAMIKVNEYFDGNVKSLVAANKVGNATVGVIAPGQYEFGTGSIEVMTVVWGELKAQLPSGDWKTYKQGDSFRVEKGVSFKVEASDTMSYLCQYL